MPAPYRYDIAPVDVGNYFDAFRAGRADRMAAEGEARNKSLSQYLPGALKGDATMRDQALASASPDQQINLASTFAQMDAQTLAKTKEMQAEGAAMAVWADTPEKWAIWNAEGKKRNPAFQEAPFEQRGAIIAKAQTVADQLDQVWKQKSYDLDASRTRAQNAASYASAEAARRKPIPGIDPFTGARMAPPGVQGRDSGELAKIRQSADAAANIAATLMSAAPALSKIDTGPGTSIARGVAGVFANIPGFSSAQEFSSNFDAIDQASKTIGIDTLQKVGGSDTERELLTAIQTTVNADVRPEENMRRFKDQIAAADILSKKAQFATEWVNKAGSLSYALPNGMTWPQFWSEYQKAAWSDHRRAAQARPGGGDYRSEQRQLLNQPRQGAAAPPPGFKIVP